MLLAAALLLPIIRLALSALPFQTVRRLLALLARSPRRADAARSLTPDRVAWATTVAARYVPGRWTCLVQALVLQLLLLRHGHAASLRLGVARHGSGEFAAHAWVECRGRPVLGESLAVAVTPLPALERK